MDINVTNNVTFGMKAITSLKQYAKTHSHKRIKINSAKWEKANETIRKALQGTQQELQRARESASKARLTK